MRLFPALFLPFFSSIFVLVVANSSFAADLTDEQFNKHMDKYFSKPENIGKMWGKFETHLEGLQEEARKKEMEARMQAMEDQFKNPVKVDAGSSPSKGPESAKVTVIEFSDFQCPYCKRGASTMDELLKEYPRDVRLVFKNLPLGFHQQAKPAAVAALAAGEQGKFWEMHDELFNNQQALGDNLYPELAKKLGLDLEKFKMDLAREDLAKQVDEDMALAAKLGVEGTPGFFVNGVRVEGAQPLPVFKQLVDRWLKEGK